MPGANNKPLTLLQSGLEVVLRKRDYTMVPEGAGRWWARHLNTMVMDSLRHKGTTNNAPLGSTEYKVAEGATNISAMLDQFNYACAPRIVPVEPLLLTEVYTGHDLLYVWEDNPAYHAIPAGSAIEIRGQQRPRAKYDDGQRWPQYFTLELDIPTYYVRRDDYDHILREAHGKGEYDVFRREHTW